MSNNLVKVITGSVLLTVLNTSLIAQTGPAGVGNSSGSNGQPKNIMWVDASVLGLANGADVSSWTDLSGNANHATQATTNNMPIFSTGIINGKPVVRFRPTTPNRTQTFLAFDGSSLINSEYSIFSVSARRSLGFKLILGGTNGTGNQNLHWGWRDNTQFTLAQWGNDINRTLSTNTAGVFSVFSSVRRGSTNPWGRAIFQDGAMLGASDNNVTLLTSYDGASIGRLTTNYYDIDVAELILYSSALNEAQRLIVDNYLAAKYGLSLGSNQFYTNATYNYGVVGIGSSDGTVKHTETSGSGGGILLKEAESSFDEAGEFVFAGHDNTAVAEVVTDLPVLPSGNLTGRSQRVWYVDRTPTTNTSISIGFTLAEVGLGAGVENQIFYLLYRSGTSGSFTTVPGAQGVLNDGKVWLKVTDANLVDGYYTIARSDLTGRTWYSYNTGNWDNWQTWSLEQGGADIVNPDMLTPTTSPTALTDKVVIVHPYIVTVSTNNKQNALLNVLDGTINFGTTTGHSFDLISGQGTIRLSADNFPGGDASAFVASGGGTVQYNGSGYTLSVPRTYNNMVVLLTNSTDAITLLSNYTTNGYVNIQRGILQINDNSNTTPLSLIVNQDFTVYSEGQLTVGTGNTIGTYSIPGTMPAIGQYHSIYHQLKIGGDLLNDGIIKLTNLSAPVYNQFANNGAVTLTFTGATNNSALLHNTTDLYNLIIDKGVDRTFVLEINSDNTNYFRIFGPNNVGRLEGAPFSGANPEVRKALWIKNGTLKLTGDIVIPSLSEGNTVSGNGDYPIPGNGALWISGQNVKVYSTARTASPELIAGTLGVNDGSSNQALSVYGEFRMTDGYFNTRNSAGFIFWADASAVIRIEGGLCDIAQFRSANGVAGGKTSFIMSGGELMVRGNRQFTYNLDYVSGYQVNPDGGGEITGAYPTFGIVDPDGVFQMSGGKIYVTDDSGDNTYSSNGFCVQADVVNHTATGGSVYMLLNNNDNFDLISDGPLFDLVINKYNGTTNASVHMGSDLTLNGSLTIGSYTQLYARRQFGNYSGRVRDLSVARTFSVSANANYFPFNNTTTLLVTYTSGLTLNNTNQYFYNLLVKNNPSFTATRRTLGGNTNDVTIYNDLTVESGAVLRHANKNIIVRGNMNNSGTIELTDPVTNTGKIQFTSRGIVRTITVTNGGSYTAIPTISLTAPPAGGTQATAVPVFDGTPSAGNALPIVAIAIVNSGSGYTTAPTVTITGGGGATATTTILTQHILGGDGNGVVGNMEVNEPHPSEAAGKIETVYLSENQTISNRLTLTDGILDLRSELLTLEGSLGSEVVTNYSPTKMIRTLGKHSDLGMRRRVNGNATYIYPFGVYTKTGDGNRYTPSSNAISVFADDGYVQVNPVDAELPTLAPSAQSALQYYWRVRHDGFTAVPRVYNIFYFYNTPATYYPGAANPSSWRPGKVVGVNRIYDLGPLNWNNGTKDLSLEYSHQDAGQTGNTPPILQEGEFTTGHNTRFAGSVQIFYLRANGNWRTNTTWSYTRGGVAVPAGQYPQAGDIAVIRRLGVSYSGLVEITNAEAAAKVIFDDENGFSSGCPRLWFSNAASFNSNFFAVEVAETHQGGTLNYETHGAVMQFDLFTGYAGQFPTGDFGDFFNYPNALVIYRNEGATNPITLPSSVTEYPQVWFDPPNNKTFILPDANVTFHGLVIVTYGHDLRFNSGSNASATFEKRLDIGHSFGSGIVSFPGSASADQTITAMSNIRLINNSQLRILNPAGGGRTHKLIAQGDISMETGCTFNLGDGNTANTNVVLELQGSTDNTFTGAGTASVNLHRIVVNKGATRTPKFTFDWDFNLNGPTDGATANTKALELQNGTLVLNNSGIDITLSSGGSDFEIPSTTGLSILNGIARVTTAGSNGILLDGYINIEGTDAANQGQLILDGGVGSDNYIQYSSSGNAEIRIATGKLVVGSQIRSSALNSLGVLRYSQLSKAGSSVQSSVTVGLRSAPVNTRGIFEVYNSGSRFQIYNGTLTIARAHDNVATATRAALYIDPQTTGLNQWGTIQIGDPVNNPTGGTITVNSTQDLCRMIVNGNATAKLNVNGLGLIGELDIRAGSTFDGSLLNLTLQNDITNRGTANLNVDTLSFIGNDQDIDGDIAANNILINPTTGVNLTGATNTVTANNNLIISNGTLADNAHTIAVKGDLINNATHATTGLGRILLNGISLQRVYGTGQFGALELDNSQGAYLEADLYLNNDFYLTNGIFNINSHLFTLSQNSLIQGSGYSSSKMIITNGSFGDAGIKKFIPAGPFNFDFPIGSGAGLGAKYTQVEFVISDNSSAGSIAVHPVNQAHMTVIGPNVLQYYWSITSTGITNFTGNAHLHYINSDVVGDEALYYSARLLGDAWAKFPPETVLEDDDYISVDYTGVSDISGDYTAGYDSDIPAQIPIFISNGIGNWSDPTKWTRLDGLPVPAGGPQGYIVQIREGDVITMDRFRILSYRTQIFGRLEVGLEIGHNLGYVSGSGTLVFVNEKVFPGEYTDFLTCGTGGTVEFGGDSYDIPLFNNYSAVDDQFNNLVITGTGIKVFPDRDNIRICNDLSVLETATLKLEHFSRANSSYKFTRIGGDIYVGSTAFLDTDYGEYVYLAGDFNMPSGGKLGASYTYQFFNLNGVVQQIIDGNFNGVNGFNNFWVNNANGAIFQNGGAVFKTFLYPQRGEMATSNSSVATLSKPDGTGLRYNAGFTGYVDGPVKVNVGPSTIYGYLPVGSVDNTKFFYYTTLPSAVSYWTGEYFDTNPYDPLSMTGALQYVSAIEHWNINSDVARSVQFRLPITATSDAASGVTNVNNLRIARWNGSQWVEIPSAPTAGSTKTSGFVQTNAAYSFTAGTDEYFTLASVESIVIPTAQFTSGNANICEGSSTDLTITMTGNGPWDIEYSDGTSTFTLTDITSPYTFSVSPATTRTYTITTVTDNAATSGVVIGSNPIITVIPDPTAYSVTGTTTICGVQTATISLSDSEVGYTYELYRDGVATGNTKAGTNLALSFTGISLGGTYTIMAYRTGYPLCYEPMTGSAIITVSTGASATVTGLATGSPICSGDPVQVEIVLVGTPPFNFTVNESYSGRTFNITNLNEASGSTYTYTINPAPAWVDQGVAPNYVANYTYTVTAVSDNSGCGVGSSSGSVTVEVHKLPETGPQYHVPNNYGY